MLNIRFNWVDIYNESWISVSWQEKSSTQLSNACAGKESLYNYILRAEEAVGLNPVI